MTTTTTKTTTSTSSSTSSSRNVTGDIIFDKMMSEIEERYNVAVREWGDWLELIPMGDYLMEGRYPSPPKGWHIVPPFNGGKPWLTNLEEKQFNDRYRREGVRASVRTNPDPNLPWEIGVVAVAGPARLKRIGNIQQSHAPAILIWSDGKIDYCKEWYPRDIFQDCGPGDYCGYCGSFLGKEGEDRMGWQCPHCGGS